LKKKVPQGELRAGFRGKVEEAKTTKKYELCERKKGKDRGGLCKKKDLFGPGKNGNRVL